MRHRGCRCHHRSARSSARTISPADIVDDGGRAPSKPTYAGDRRAAAAPRIDAAAPEGRKLLRLEIRNAETPIERKPEWIKTKAKMGPEYTALHSLVKDEGLHTVCQEAGCPNIYECWEDREATFLIGGSQCTRRCDFCQIDTGKPADYDTRRTAPRRRERRADAAALRHGHRRRARRPARRRARGCTPRPCARSTPMNPNTGVEILATDFNGDPALLGEVFDSRPEVFAHNVETVPRIFKRIRPAFRYERSLDVLTQARDAGLITKSNLILGMGEEPEEVVQALQDLHDAGTDIITITQYLRPSPRHLPVARWVKPARVRGVQGGGRAHRLPRRARRAAGALVVPRRPPLGAVDDLEGPRHPAAPRAHRRGASTTGSPRRSEPRAPRVGAAPSGVGGRVTRRW